MGETFPDFIRALPEPDSPVRMRAHIVPNDYLLPMFYEMDDDVDIPEHTQGAQWGVVLDGTMRTLRNETRSQQGLQLRCEQEEVRPLKIEASCGR